MEMKTITRIEKIIYIIRDQKVMLDSDLAELYEVETKTLNQAVRRNLERFPSDFMFVCNSKELEDLRSQFVTANPSSTWNHKRRTSPMLFTEGGIAMLSTAVITKYRSWRNQPTNYLKLFLRGWMRLKRW